MPPLLLALLAAVALLVAPSPAPSLAAAPAGAVGAPAGVGLVPGARVPAPPVAARGRFGGRRSVTRARPRSQVRRPRPRNVGRSLLHALGIAYLVHLLFGWGPGGGSPIPLLVILGLVAWLVVRRRQSQRTLRY